MVITEHGSRGGERFTWLTSFSVPVMAHDKLGQCTGSMEPKKDSEQLVLESGILGKSKVH